MRSARSVRSTDLFLVRPKAQPDGSRSAPARRGRAWVALRRSWRGTPPSTGQRDPHVPSRGGNQIGTVAVRDDGVHKVPAADSVACDQADTAVDLWTLVSRATDDALIGFLDEHLYAFADPRFRTLGY